ncbi:uncharacterized protein LOC120350300 [Nilaparvata lugens]|uniref:uncharacterized protein LOC120350300 n=1 Tax=Nilaparvata lugens TaxID=108931 RepID=UPI00193C9BD4|nr:uncharacterized protein LOC120350300 [Nilaparvata lugens]
MGCSERRISYISIQITGLREVKTLKSLYDGLEMKARKEKTEERLAIYKTGGGVPSSSMTPLSNKIVGQLESHFEPLSNPYDSSSSFFDEPVMVIPATEEVEEVVEVEKAEEVKEVVEVENKEIPTPTRPSKKAITESPIKNMEKTRKRKFEALLKEQYYAKEHDKKMIILAKEERAADLKIHCVEP